MELIPSGLSATRPIEKCDTPIGGRPSVSSHVPLGTPGGSFTTFGARSPYSFCTRSHAAGGSLTWLSAEISLNSGIDFLHVHEARMSIGSWQTIWEPRLSCQGGGRKWLLAKTC